MRLFHPFPSTLDAVVTVVLALLAGAGVDRAAVLGGAMLLLQASIGAVNDVTDSDRDRGRKPGKPIPAGLIGRTTATRVALACLLGGLAAAAAAGLAALVIAAAGAAIGFAYDLRLKPSPWAWLPFAIGVPLLPAFAWVGASGRFPAGLVAMIPIAVAAGAGLAMANGLADYERDRSSGLATPATRLGIRATWRIGAGLETLAALLGIGSLVWINSDPRPIALALAGCAIVSVGLACGHQHEPRRRELGWEIEACGLGILAAGWAVAFAERGLL